MLYSILLAIHVLGVAIWVGGMFFAYNALRPAAVETLEPPLRLTLWVATLRKFFVWVWLCVVGIFFSGMGMLVAISTVFTHIAIMAGLGILMMLIFAHVYFAPFGRLKKAVTSENWPEGGKFLGQIRTLVGINTLIGLATIVVATAGRNWF